MFRFWLKEDIIWIIILKYHPRRDDKEVKAKTGKPPGNYYNSKIVETCCRGRYAGYDISIYLYVYIDFFL